MKTVKMNVTLVTAAFFAVRDASIREANPNERDQLMNILLTAIAERMQVPHRKGYDYTYCYDRENNTFSYTEREFFWTAEQRLATTFCAKKEYVITFQSSDTENAQKYTIVVAGTQEEARVIACEAYGGRWAFCYRNPDEAGVTKFGLVLRDYLEG